MLKCVCVGAGGCIGAVLRYLLSQLPLGSGAAFPWKTLLINILGAFAIGLIAALSLKGHELHPNLVLFLKVGICGGFTTFSTFALESFDLFGKSAYGTALLYIVLSVLLSVLAVAAAELCVR